MALLSAKRRATSRRVGMVLALAFTLAAVACGGGEQAPALEGAIVDTLTVRSADVPTTIRAVGTIEADHQATVAAEVRGRVTGIIQDEGSRVEAGAPVIQLDASPYRFATESAEAELFRAEAQLATDTRLFERYEKLLEAGAIDQQAYEDLEARVIAGQAAVEQARAAVHTARWDLDRATIRAPFGGVVGKRYARLGAYLDQQDAAFDLVDSRPVRVRFSVPEFYAGVLQTGAAVRFEVRAGEAGERSAEIDYVSPEIDPDTRTIEVTAHYANEDRDVVPGAYADVTVIADVHEAAPIVPEKALYAEGQSNYVYVVVDGPSAERRSVELGSRIGDEVEIRAGVEVGEIVITDGQYGLPDGAPIRFADQPDETLERTE